MKAKKATVLSEDLFRKFSDVFSPHLASLDIDPAILSRADIEIPEERYLALWEAVGKQRPNAGIELGIQTKLDDLGVIGAAISCASSIEKTLETIHKYIVVYAQDCTSNYKINNKYVALDYHVDQPAVLHRRQDAEFAVTAILRQLQRISKGELYPIRVDFEHEKPEDISLHREVFQCEIYFNQPINKLYFDRNILNFEVNKRNDRLYQALEFYLNAQREERSLADDLLSEVTKIITSNLINGSPSLVSISDDLGMSARTLQRRLQKLNIEFSTLVENVRRDLAISFMSNDAYSISEVAMLVGYSETSSFSRAFKRWTGQSPQQYKSA